MGPISLRKRRFGALVVVVVLVLLVAYLCFSYIGNQIRTMRTHSDMLFLDNVIRTTLSAYYRAHGCYPSSLEEVRLDIVRACYDPPQTEDGRYRALLDRFQYNSDGCVYDLSWQIETSAGVRPYHWRYDRDRRVVPADD